MSVKFVGNRGKLAAYDLYLRHGGRRYRKRVICLRSVVKEQFREWANQITTCAEAKVECTFRDRVEEYQIWARGNKSEAQNQADAYHFRLALPCLGAKLLTEIKRKDAVDLRGHRSQVGVRPATVNRFTSTLSCFFNWAIEREYVMSNPFARIRLSEMNIRTPILSQGQYRELLDFSPLKLKPWIYIAIFSGLRMGEIGKLRWSQIDLAAALISLLPTETKGKRERIIPVTPVLADFLVKRKAANPEATFVIQGDKPHGGCGREWRKFRNALPWAVAMGLRFHDLRHACATALRMKNVDLHEVGEILGHKDLKTTMRYAHFAGTVRHEKMSRIDDYIFGSGAQTVGPGNPKTEMSNGVANGVEPSLSNLRAKVNKSPENGVQ